MRSAAPATAVRRASCSPTSQGNRCVASVLIARRIGVLVQELRCWFLAVHRSQRTLYPIITSGHAPALRQAPHGSYPPAGVGQAAGVSVGDLYLLAGGPMRSLSSPYCTPTRARMVDTKSVHSVLVLALPSAPLNHQTDQPTRQTHGEISHAEPPSTDDGSGRHVGVSAKISRYEVERRIPCAYRRCSPWPRYRMVRTCPSTSPEADPASGSQIA